MNLREDITNLVKRGISAGINPDQHFRTWQQLYFVSFLIFVIYHLVNWPIMMTDSDLWFHLSNGKYLFENGSIPNNSFFSFVTPPGEWTNYSWLFQALVYQVFNFSGYLGLIIMRTAVYLLTIFIIYRFFLSGADDKRHLLFLLLISVLFSIFIVHRFIQVRPHIFSYLLIALFIYLIETRSRLVFLLPVLAIFWVNIHGVEYPAMIIITYSYSLELLGKRIIRKTHLTTDELKYLVPIVIAMLSLFLTPHGWNLLETPYHSIGETDQYVSELQKVTLTSLLSFNIIKLTPTFSTIFQVIFSIITLSFIYLLITGKVKLSHIFMTSAGYLLLVQGNRFTYEFILLSMPMIKQAVSMLPLSSGKKLPIAVSISLVAVMLVTPYTTITGTFRNSPKYPFSTNRLPHGTASFLLDVKAEGTVMNNPNTGGYLEWLLYPQNKIYMNSQFNLFSGEEFYMIQNVFHDKVILKKYLSKYEPSFISVPIGVKVFKELIKEYPDYLPVFFDDVSVLYANKVDNPAIAAEYELKKTDPFALIGLNIDNLSKEERVGLLNELEGILKIHTGSGLANEIMAISYNLDEEFEKALPFTNAIIREFPEAPKGYKLKGDALKGLKRYEEALQQFKLARKRTADAGELSALYKQMGFTYAALNEYRKAYRVFRKGVPLYSPAATYKDLFYLGSHAILAGDVKTGISAFKFAYAKVPEDDEEWYEKIKKQIELLEIGG